MKQSYEQMKQTLPKIAAFNNICRYLMMSLSALTLLACSSSNEAPPTSKSSTSSYTPNAERLLEEATNSDELYVEADFRFDQNQVTQLNILSTDSDGQPIPYTRLNIYLIDTNQMEEALTEWSDTYASRAHLIAGGLSNNQGEFTRVIEFPKSTQTTPLLLIEINAMGFENKVLVPVESERTSVTLGAI